MVVPVDLAAEDVSFRPPAWSNSIFTPTSWPSCRVTTLSSASAHSELSASPRNPNVPRSCKPAVWLKKDAERCNCFQIYSYSVGVAEQSDLLTKKYDFLSFGLCGKHRARDLRCQTCINKPLKASIHFQHRTWLLTQSWHLCDGVRLVAEMETT